jgi:hypothetical protein
MSDEKVCEIFYDKTTFPQPPNLERKSEEKGQMFYDRSGSMRPEGHDEQVSPGKVETPQGIYDKTLPSKPTEKFVNQSDDVKPFEGMTYEFGYPPGEGEEPVVVLGFKEEGNTTVKLKDAPSHVIKRVEGSFEAGNHVQVLNHYLEICQESEFLDSKMIPTIRTLVEKGKAIKSAGDWKAFVNELKKFRSSLKMIKDHQTE